MFLARRVRKVVSLPAPYSRPSDQRAEVGPISSLGAWLPCDSKWCSEPTHLELKVDRLREPGGWPGICSPGRHPARLEKLVTRGTMNPLAQAHCHSSAGSPLLRGGEG